MQNKVIYRDLGLMPYKQAWDLQKQLFEVMLGIKTRNRLLADQEKEEQIHRLLFCEHPHVYTIGKSGNDSNLLIDQNRLKAYGAELFHIDRGGDITYHGPGQIVGYPLFDLQNFGIGIKEYVHRIEEAIILTLKSYGIEAGRLQGATGVWLDAGTAKARKICAIGVKASRFITMHGFAFNINTDLSYFSHINPCGFTDKGVTSLSVERGEDIDIEEVKSLLLQKLSQVFSFEIIKRTKQ